MDAFAMPPTKMGTQRPKPNGARHGMGAKTPFPFKKGVGILRPRLAILLSIILQPTSYGYSNGYTGMLVLVSRYNTEMHPSKVGLFSEMEMINY